MGWPLRIRFSGGGRNTSSSRSDTPLLLECLLGRLELVVVLLWASVVLMVPDVQLLLLLAMMGGGRAGGAWLLLSPSARVEGVLGEPLIQVFVEGACSGAGVWVSGLSGVGSLRTIVGVDLSEGGALTSTFAGVGWPEGGPLMTSAEVD